MEIWIIAICALNLLISIAIAGSVAKVIRYLGGDSPVVADEDVTETSNLPEGPLYKMENGELVQVGTPTYDQEVLSGAAEPYADGVTARPSTQNWDGIPK
jgi:hypothetical protein